jgi:hypothetical protein
MKSSFYTYLILLFAVSITISSCKEEKKNDPQPKPSTSRPTNLNLDVKQEAAKSTPSSGGNVTFGSENAAVAPPSTQKPSLTTAERDKYNRIVGSNTSSNGRIGNSSFLVWFIDGIAIDGIDYTDDDNFDFLDYFAMFFFDDDIYISFFYDEDLDDWDWAWGYFYIDNDMRYLAFDIGDPDQEVWKVDSVVNKTATETDLYISSVTDDNGTLTYLNLLLASYEVE